MKAEGGGEASGLSRFEDFQREVQTTAVILKETVKRAKALSEEAVDHDLDPRAPAAATKVSLFGLRCSNAVEFEPARPVFELPRIKVCARNIS